MRVCVVLRLLLAVLVSVVGSTQPVWGQLMGLNDPERRWFTLETEHFRLHFQEGLEGVAYWLAPIAEEQYARLKEEFGEAPDKLHVVLTDPFDFSNGFANPFGDRIVLFASQYRLSDWANVRLDSWWRLVLFHELVHAIELDEARGLNALLRRVFGEIVLPNLMKPVPFIEGLAVYEKFKYLGESRLNDSRTRMMIRQMVLDNAIPSFDEIQGLYSRERWPHLGLLWYNFGSWFLRYVEEQYGRDALARLNDVNAAHLLNVLSPLGLGTNFKQVFKRALGVEFDEAYEGFRTWLREEFSAEIERVRAEGVTVAQRLTTLGFFVESPAWSPRGDRIAYVHRGPRRAGLRVMNPDGEGDRELRAITGAPILSPTWAPDGQTLVYAKLEMDGPFSVRGDLYRLDLETGREARLTRGERAYFARVAPDGARVYYARNWGRDGSTALAVLDLNTGETRVLKAFEGNTGVIHSFAVSPDGRTLALALWRWGGFQDLYLLDLETLELKPATRNKAQVNGPAWSPDGQYVLFSADPEPDRVYNLYAYRVSDGKVFKVTNVLTGAFQPAISPEGDRIVFVGYGPEGYDLYAIPYDPARWAPVELPQEEPPGWAGFPDSTAYPVRPYNPYEHLKPLFWLPVPLPMPDGGMGVGVVTAGLDPLFWQSYVALVGLDVERGRPVVDLGYGLTLPKGLLLQLDASSRAGRNALSGALTVPLVPSLERQQLLTVGYAREWGREPAKAEAEEAETRPYARQTLRASYAYGRTGGAERFRQATSFGVEVRYFQDEGEGERGWRWAVEARWRERFRLPVEPTQYLTLSARAAWTDSERERDRVAIGGPYGPYALRGFPPKVAEGKQALVGRLEYAFPLFAVERWADGWPLFVDDVGGRLFVEAGLAGDALDLNAVKVGFGAELALSLTLGYYQPLTLLLGVAQGLGRPAPQLYLNAEFAGLF